jgi:hypothetical protein
MGTPAEQARNRQLLEMGLKDQQAQGNSPRAKAYRNMLTEMYTGGGGEAGQTQAMRAFAQQFPSEATQQAQRQATDINQAYNLYKQATGFMDDPKIQQAQSAQDAFLQQALGQEGVGALLNAQFLDQKMAEWEQQNPEFAAALARRDAAEAVMAPLMQRSTDLLHNYQISDSIRKLMAK